MLGGKSAARPYLRFEADGKLDEDACRHKRPFQRAEHYRFIQIGAQVGLPAEIIGKPVVGMPRHRVDREIPPREIVAQLICKPHAVRMAAIAQAPVGRGRTVVDLGGTDVPLRVHPDVHLNLACTHAAVGRNGQVGSLAAIQFVRQYRRTGVMALPDRLFLYRGGRCHRGELVGFPWSLEAMVELFLKPLRVLIELLCVFGGIAVVLEFGAVHHHIVYVIVAACEYLVKAFVDAFLEFQLPFEPFHLLGFGEIEQEGVLAGELRPQGGSQQDYRSVFFWEAFHFLCYLASWIAFSTVLTMMLTATLLWPPWGIMTSAKRLLGSMNCRYMGFTVRE